MGHVHLGGHDRDAHRKFRALLGGKPVKHGQLEIQAWYAKTIGPSIDHIGFEVKNLEQFIKKLEATGITFDRPYQHSALSPLGTHVELTKNLAPPASH